MTKILANLMSLNFVFNANYQCEHANTPSYVSEHGKHLCETLACLRCHFEYAIHILVINP